MGRKSYKIDKEAMGEYSTMGGGINGTNDTRNIPAIIKSNDRKDALTGNHLRKSPVN